MRRFAYSYLAFGAALLGLAALTGAGTRWDGLPWLLGSLAGATAVGVGLRVHRPRRRRFWIAIAAMELSWAAASVAALAGSSISSEAYGGTAALFIPGYAMLAWATIILLRTVGTGRPETLDAAIGTAVAALLVWPFVVNAVAVNGRSGLLGAFFPVWDLPLAMLLLRILFSAWSSKRSLRLLAIATLVLLTSDLLYFGSVFAGSSLAGRLLSTSYTAVYLLFGAAALAPSMRRIPPRPVPHSTSARGRTLLVMTCALLTTPVIFGVDQILEHDPTDAIFAAIGAATVGLVVRRVSKLLRDAEELRTRAEQSEQLFRMVFESAGVGISVGRDGIFSRTNPALHRMLGYSADELAGRHFNDVSHPDDLAIGTVAVHGLTVAFEKRYIRSDGEVVWAEVTLTKPTADGFAVAVIEDVTAAKRLEADLRHAQKMEAVGQLAGGIAHDFNNLMTAVIGYSGMLERELAAGDARRTRVEAIRSAAERAAELTRKLLAFSRRQVLRLEALDIAEAVAGFDPILRPLLPENIVVDYELVPGAIARVDRAELEQVLLNLCLNGRDAMPAGGLLTVAVRPGLREVELLVADTGMGMSAETRARIFDPFFTTKAVGSGTGLGLSTVDGIVAQLGGTIEVDTALGSGTTFTVRLPLCAAGSPVAEPVAVAAESAGGGTVLLVEDEEIVRKVTTEMLKHVGYDVTSSASAEDALLLLAAGARPDVLVSDVVMTGMDGPTLAAEARKLIPNLPVLLVSGYPAESLGGLTGETLLSKPFTPTQLAEHVEAVRRTGILS